MAHYSEDDSSDEKSRYRTSSNESKTFALRTDGAGEPAAEAPASNIGGEVYLQTESRDPDVKTTLSLLLFCVKYMVYQIAAYSSYK